MFAMPPDDPPPPARDERPEDLPGAGQPERDAAREARERADRHLVIQLLAGDEDAVRSLVQRYDRLIRYTIFKTGRRHCERDPGWLDARANEAWTGIVSALRRRGRNAIPPNVPAYFARIARNKSLDAVGKADQRQTIPFDPTGDAATQEPQTETEADPLQMLQGVEELAALRACIARLSEDEQVVCSEIGLIMERRWKEAAQQLEMPESTLRSKWGHILDKLRLCLEKKKSKSFAPPPASPDP